jgi:hypothetical protein
MFLHFQNEIHNREGDLYHSIEHLNFPFYRTHNFPGPFFQTFVNTFLYPFPLVQLVQREMHPPRGCVPF